MRSLFFTLIVICCAGPASSEEWWHGSYTPESSTLPCEKGANDGLATFSDKEVEFHEQSCEIAKKTPLIGMDAVILNLDCWGEGEQFKDRKLLLKREDGKLAQFPPLQMMKSCEQAGVPATPPVTAEAPTAACDLTKRLYRAPMAGQETYQELQFVSGITTGDVQLTEVHQGKPVWRAKGQFACSNGASICSVDFPLMSGGTYSSPYEAIEKPISPVEIIVLPAARQSVYTTERYATGYGKPYGGLVADLLNGYAPRGDELTAPFNVYQYAACAP